MTAAPAVARVRRAVATDRASQWFLGLAGVVAATIYVIVGREQWFIRDDWAFVVTRPLMHREEGWATWLFTAQDGHWMTAPLLFQRLVLEVFGLGSYWPFLLPTLLLHVVAVVLVHALCRRLGVTAWTAAVVAVLLLLFGNGWENGLFAVQITYNLSLVAFFVQVLLVDHAGPVDRRDGLGAAAGIVGVMSSAFGPFFTAATFALLAQRGRWRAAVVAAAPAAVLYAWWWSAWGRDPVGERGERSVLATLRFARLALTATLNSVTGQVLFAGAALLGIVAMCTWGRLSKWDRSLVRTLSVLPVPVMLAIGWQRAAFGLGSAASSRYQYMIAMLLAAPLALAVDQVRRFDRRALLAVRLLLLAAVVSNTRFLVDSGDEWADRSAAARRTYELVAGSLAAGGAAAQVDPATVPVPFDPDVTVGRLPILVREGAIEPRPPATPEEEAHVRAVLGLGP